MVLEAVEQRGRELEYASKKLRADNAMALEAVKKEGHALMCASEEELKAGSSRGGVLKAYKEVVLEVVTQNVLVLP